MYGQNEYGTQAYSVTGTGNGIQTEYFVDLSQLVPEFVANLLEMKEIYNTQGYELGYLQHALEDVTDQCFIVAATWGLTRWEQVFGVETNMSLSYEQRREILLAKIRGQGSTTKEMIKEVAAAYSGGEVDVIEDNPNSLFIVRFIGIKGTPRNMQAFIRTLEEIKPAHLAYRFEYRYTVWEELLPYIWRGLSGMTWDDVRILKEA